MKSQKSYFFSDPQASHLQKRISSWITVALSFRFPDPAVLLSSFKEEEEEGKNQGRIRPRHPLTEHN
jgi:hypothetical protein